MAVPPPPAFLRSASLQRSVSGSYDNSALLPSCSGDRKTSSGGRWELLHKNASPDVTMTSRHELLAEHMEKQEEYKMAMKSDMSTLSSDPMTIDPRLFLTEAGLKEDLIDVRVEESQVGASHPTTPQHEKTASTLGATRSLTPTPPSAVRDKFSCSQEHAGSSCSSGVSHPFHFAGQALFASPARDVFGRPALSNARFVSDREDAMIDLAGMESDSIGAESEVEKKQHRETDGDGGEDCRVELDGPPEESTYRPAEAGRIEVADFAL